MHWAWLADSDQVLVREVLTLGLVAWQIFSALSYRLFFDLITYCYVNPI